MFRIDVLVWLLAGAAACSCKQTPSTPAVSSAPPVVVQPAATVQQPAPTASAVAAPTATTVPVASAPAPSTTGSAQVALGVEVPIELPYRGQLGSEPSVFRVTRTRGLLEIRYFTEAAGVDVLLKGRINSDGDFSLKERDSAAEWKGTLKEDALSATRTLADVKLELSATRMKPGSGPKWAPVFVATKRIPAKCPDNGDHSAKFEYLEFVGAFSSEREAELNKELVPTRDAMGCSATDHPRLESRVLFNADGFISIELRSTVLYTLPSVPPSAWSQRYRTYSLALQKQLTNEELYDGDIDSRKREEVFREHVGKARSTDPALAENEKVRPTRINRDRDCFAVEGSGVRFISQHNPKLWNGVLIPYPELTQLGFFSRKNPIATLAFRDVKAP